MSRRGSEGVPLPPYFRPLGDRLLIQYTLLVRVAWSCSSTHLWHRVTQCSFLSVHYYRRFIIIGILTSLQSISTHSSISIYFCKHKLSLDRTNHLIYFSQSQLLLAKTNEHRTVSRQALYKKTEARSFKNKIILYVRSEKKMY